MRTFNFSYLWAGRAALFTVLLLFANGADGQQKAPPQLQPAKKGPGPEIGLLMVMADKIQPAQITRPAGTFVLVIKNYSGISNLSLQITQTSNGASVQQAVLDSRYGNWDQTFNLPAGIYEISEPNHPLLRATLTLK